MSKIILAISLSATLVLSGCATIMGERTQVMPISSQPVNAKIEITDEKGAPIFTGSTPTSLTLEKSDGSYWGKKSYTVKITKEGYAPQTIPITANPNGWYIAGNFIFGGLIGWFIVDPLNGAMYTLSPERIDPTLSSRTSHNNNGENGTIAIMLLKDVPERLREKMVRVN